MLSLLLAACGGGAALAAAAQLGRKIFNDANTPSLMYASLGDDPARPTAQVLPAQCQAAAHGSAASRPSRSR